MTGIPFLSPRHLRPAAMLLVAAGLVAGCQNTGSPTANANTARATSAPVSCAMNATSSGSGTLFQGRVTAAEQVSGSYSLQISGSGTNIRQGGPFTARAGETLTLGQATLSGSASRYNSDFSVTVNGATYRCD